MSFDFSQSTAGIMKGMVFPELNNTNRLIYGRLMNEVAEEVFLKFGIYMGSTLSDSNMVRNRDD